MILTTLLTTTAKDTSKMMVLTSKTMELMDKLMLQTKTIIKPKINNKMETTDQWMNVDVLFTTFAFSI